MQKLILLYWGTVFLMYLSQVYFPVDGRPAGRPRRFAAPRADIFMLAAIFWLTCFSFLRTSYNDTGTYIFSWRNAEPVSEFIAGGGLRDLTGNPLSMLWQSLSHSVAENYHVYFLPPAFLSSFAAIKLFKRYSVTPAFSLLIFFSIGTYIMYIAAMKQCFAMFFLLLSIPYAVEKKYVRFYLLVAIAILFHTHAFVFAILPLLMGKPWKKMTWLLLAATVFAMLTYDFTLGAFMRYAQSLGALVDEGELFDGHQINVLRVMVYWVPALLALVFRGRLFRDSTREEDLFVNMSIVSAFILTIGMVQAANLFARMAAYFEIATAVALPWMIRKIFTKPSARLVTICAATLYFVYFLYEFGASKGFGGQYRSITLWQFFQELVQN